MTKSVEATPVPSQKSIREIRQFCSTQAINSVGEKSDDSVTSTRSRAAGESSHIPIPGTSRKINLSLE